MSGIPYGSLLNQRRSREQNNSREKLMLMIIFGQSLYTCLVTFSISTMRCWKKTKLTKTTEIDKRQNVIDGLKLDKNICFNNIYFILRGKVVRYGGNCIQRGRHYLVQGILRCTKVHHTKSTPHIF